MPRIELSYLIKPTTTPAQEILLSHFFTQFDNGSAANKRILNVEPLFYTGAIAGTEFLTYAATKLYLCYNTEFSRPENILDVVPNVYLYNEADAISFNLVNGTTIFNTVTNVPNFGQLNVSRNNCYFSRVAVANYLYIIFNGYRVTLN